MSKDSCLLENRSGKNAIITKIQAIPEEAAGLLIAEGLPKFVTYGDNYKFMIVRVMGTGIESIKVKWHFEDEPEIEHEVVRNATKRQLKSFGTIGVIHYLFITIPFVSTTQSLANEKQPNRSLMI